MDDVFDADVAIVGAGLAGLTAAWRLAEAGASPLILEARQRVGGRLLNEELGDDKVVELGGQWIGQSQRRIGALAADLGVETFPTHDEGEHLIELAGKRISYSGRLTDARLGSIRRLVRGISPPALADFEQARIRLDRMARSVPLEAPWEAPRARRWDSQTLASWIYRNARTKGARRLFELAVEAVWAAEPADLSLLHALFYLHSGGGFEALLGTRGGAQQDRFRGGSQRIATRLAERLGEERLRLGAAVGLIEHGERGVVLHTRCGGATRRGCPVRARAAILALAPTLAARISYDPPLPAQRDQLTQRMPQGTVIKTMAIYERPFWREAGMSGQATSDIGPARVVFDNSPPDGAPGILLGFLEGRVARRWGSVPATARRDAVLAGHARLFGPQAATPQRFVECVWADEEWSRGCYGSLMIPGAWTDYGRALREPVGPLHWAGAETATVWNGYMDGAVQSGDRAAGEVLAALNA
jgi:monoamine oxidase